VFGDNFESMDLIANTPDEANIWVTGLTCLLNTNTKSMTCKYADQLLQAHALTLSPLNKIMDHSNTALWTIPNFQFGEFWQILSWNSKIIINIFKQFRPWSEGSHRSPLIWVLTVWKNYMNSLQRVTGLKGLSRIVSHSPIRDHTHPKPLANDNYNKNQRI